MNIPVRIHPGDTDAEVAARHLQIAQRLDELGVDQVELLFGTGGLPSAWDVLVVQWLEGHPR